MSAEVQGVDAVLELLADYLEVKAQVESEPMIFSNWDAYRARVLPIGERLHALSPAHLRALAAQAEAGRDSGTEDGYRIALDDALPVLELCLERGRVLDRMTQPSMGRHPLQDEYERVDYRLRRASKWYKLWPVVQQARAALAAAQPAPEQGEVGGE